MIVPSRYQRAIFEFLQHEAGHAVVDAVPGSGKTTTLLEAAHVLPRGVKTLFVAFHAHITRELAEKLQALKVARSARPSTAWASASWSAPWACACALKSRSTAVWPNSICWSKASRVLVWPISSSSWPSLRA